MNGIVPDNAFVSMLPEVNIYYLGQEFLKRRGMKPSQLREEMFRSSRTDSPVRTEERVP